MFGRLTVRRLRRGRGVARRPVHNEIVVVAAAEPDLLVVAIDPRTDCHGLAEVKRRAGHIAQFAGRDQSLVYRREAVGVEFQFVLENISSTGEIEVSVIREVEHRLFVGGGAVIDRSSLSSVSV